MNAAQSVIDFSPLIPAVNGMIIAVAGVLTASTPFIAYYIVMWLRAHGLVLSQQAQADMVKQADAVIANGLKYSVQATDAQADKLDKVSVANPLVAKAANYAIAQAPALLTKLGYDPTTEAGQQSIVRMVTARIVPTPPPADTNVTVTLAQPVEAPASAKP